MNAIDDQRHFRQDAIAIVGIGCRFPGGVTDVRSFWSLLRSRGNAITEIPADRWSLDGFFDQAPDNPYRSYSKWGGFLDDVASFDPDFFGLSRREAEAMDPQQRILLQVAHEAAEDAGMPLERLRTRSTGVYVGVSNPDYGLLQRFEYGVGDIQAGTGTALSIVANRLSNVLDLRGPSLGIDTACSSSLVALDAACRALRDRTIDIGLAGGVNVLLDPRMFITFSRARMLSKAGRVAAFDAEADGFVRGEGAGIVVLKRLDDALRDRDRVYATVVATAVNQDGRTDAITAPNPAAQKAMIRTALAIAGVAAEDVAYVEAHGTGTPVGDPIEAEAIGEVLGKGARPPVLIGTVKGNIGHLEPAAGIAGLIKAALVLANGEIPPSVNFAIPSPRIPFGALNIDVVRDCVTLAPDGPQNALVNAFGFGGTNACALLSRPAPARTPPPVAGRKTAAPEPAHPRLLPVPISAPTEAHLAAWAKTLAEALRNSAGLAGISLDALAAALVRQRSHFDHRAVILASDSAGLAAKLTALGENRDWPRVDKTEPPAILKGKSKPRGKLVFTCTGQGGQFWNMARDFLESHPVFRRFVEEFDALFAPIAGWSVIDALSAEEAESRLHDPAVTPAAMFALQAGLARIWESVGIAPDILIGHSFGEVTAAYLAGAIELADVAHLVNHRGLIRGHIDRVGAMAAIGLGEGELAAFLPSDGSIEIGAYNSPSMVTVSGEKASIDGLIARLKERDPNVLARLLDLDFAWHSSWLEPGKEIFLGAVGEQPWRTPRLPVISTVTGQFETRFDTEYWWRNLRNPVRFDRAVALAIDSGADRFVELGPSRTLSSPTAACAAAKGRSALTVTTLQRGQDNFASFGVALAELYVAGEDIAWERLSKPDGGHVALPQMPFLQERLWRAPEEAEQHLFGAPSHALLGKRQPQPGYVWSSTISLAAFPVLGEHRIMGSCVLPGAVIIAMMHAVAVEVHGSQPIELADVRLPEALFIANDDSIALHTQYEPDRSRLRVWSRLKGRSDAWTLRAEARLYAREIDASLLAPARRPPPPPTPPVDAPDFYARAERDGYHFGPAFRGIARLQTGTGAVCAEVRLPAGAATAVDYAPLDPRLLDSCLQVIIASRDSVTGVGKLFLPETIDRILIAGSLGSSARVEAETTWSPGAGVGEFSLSLADAGGDYRVRIEGLHARAIESGTARPSGMPDFIEETFVEASPATGHSAIRHWLVMSSPGGQSAAALADALAAAGHPVRRVGSNQPPEDIAEAIASMIAIVALDEPAAIVYAAPADLACDDWPAAARIEDEVAGLVAFGQSLSRLCKPGEPAPAIWVLTRHARSVGSADPLGMAGLAQSALLGAARTLAIECPDIRFRLVDVDHATLARPETLAAILSANGAEHELLVRDGKVLVPRLTRKRDGALVRRHRPASQLPSRRGFALRQDGARGIDGLHWEECVERPPGPGQASVRINVAGLNFRDLMAATGLLPKEAETSDAGAALGLEFTGTVESVGEGVSTLAPGDRVIGMVGGSLCRTVTIDIDRLYRPPAFFDDAEAASILSVYVTAHYALSIVGRLRAGETVLVHSGAGGVGLAAITLAKRLGARIFATAGSPEKRSYLKSLGVHAAIDSRSLSFADDVLAATGGHGVDVVLNALPGPFIEKGLACLAPYGRFVELGKRDIYDDRSLGLKALRRNLSLHVVDLAALIEERPDLAREMTGELLALFASRELLPPPVTVFPAGKVSDAFRTFATARHVGKIVVDMRDPELSVRMTADHFPVDPAGTYLVTGGLSGFGFEIGRRLAEAGAGRIVLASRSGTPPADVAAGVARLKERGVEITVAALDVVDAYQVEALTRDLARGPMPLRGIVHAAAAYADALLGDMTPDKVARVLSPKVAGGLNLTRAVLATGAEIDFFLSISSLAQVLGWRGQANYAAANAFLEGLASVQRAHGIPGSCLSLGMLSESGFVARSSAMADYLRSAGWLPLSNEQALTAVRTALASEKPALTYAAADWTRLSHGEPVLAGSTRLAQLISDPANASSAQGLVGLPAGVRKAAATTAIRNEIAALLRLDPAKVAGGDLLGELGLDSLSSFELWHRIEAALGMPIPLARFSEAGTLDSLADLACMLATETASASAEAAHSASGVVSGEDAPPLLRRPEDALAAPCDPTGEELSTGMDFVRARCYLAG
jgi:acyl transferase domain-containing protein/NAD(P)-dependent dehydrogenase (short-subunit alcohol dehydrogenase family)/acyl carrier protein